MPSEQALRRGAALLAFNAAVVTMAFAPAIHAQPALAQTKGCLACHALDRKVVGPAYKDVAAKYAGQKGATDALAQKVVKGSVGAWGPVPMPANPQVSEAEARQLVDWILTVK